MSNRCWSCQERSVTNQCHHARTTKIVKLPVILIMTALVVAGTIMEEQLCQLDVSEEAPRQEDFDSIPPFLKLG